MFGRMVHAVTRLLGHGRPDIATTTNQIKEVVQNPEIVFHPMDPVSSTNTASCHCPVTRQPLKQGDRIFQCRMCLMAYSEPGWEFLRHENKGMCCGCGGKKTIFLFVAFDPSEP